LATFILNTVGTSLLNHFRNADKKGLPRWQSVVAELNKLESTDHRCGAEINSLASLFKMEDIAGKQLTPPYHLAFLISDTEEGRWIGEVLKHYAESGNRQVEIGGVEVVTVEGLQPEDPRLFANVGLRNLVKEACRLLQNKQGMTRVINATGGFKAQISFAGLIGQTVGVPVVYMFETFDYCIQMPPMPVDFNRDIWLAHYDIFTAGGITTATEHEFENEVEESLRPLFLHETDGEQHMYTLSPILELMHQGFLNRPWLARVCEPRPSDKKPEQKLAINKSEMPHAAKRSQQFMEKLTQYPWVEKIENIKCMNTRRSHLLDKDYPDAHAAVGLVFCDSDKGLEIKVTTTSSNDGELDWCKQKLNELLQG
jgi:putative CRISPR-associated protein (TIGR02619 family)